MSHKSIRKEKDCLNCGRYVADRYCTHCGQENINPQESVVHFVTHFIGDLFHFDGKFFKTLKLLFTKPGFLAEEYSKGKRADYVNPIRLYIFTSFAFFLIFFSVNHIEEEDLSDTTRTSILKSTDHFTPEEFSKFTAQFNKGVPMDSITFQNYKDSVVRLDSFTWDSNKYRSIAEYDSLIKAGKVKDGWLDKMRIRKQISITEKYGPYGWSKFLKDFLDSLLHSFPQMLFISLPLVALLFYFLYHRQKKYLYVSHAVFTLHFYVVFFIAMLIGVGLDELDDRVNWAILDYLQLAFYFGVWFYLYKALRCFYKQRRAKTILKFFLFMFSFFLILIFLIVVFSIKSWMQV